eukprot:scaffold71021_cov33-Tisochrysis_lutea.AAC.2
MPSPICKRCGKRYDVDGVDAPEEDRPNLIHTDKLEGFFRCVCCGVMRKRTTFAEGSDGEPYMSNLNLEEESGGDDATTTGTATATITRTSAPGRAAAQATILERVPSTRRWAATATPRTLCTPRRGA